MSSIEHSSGSSIWVILIGIIFLVGATFGLSMVRDNLLTPAGDKLSKSELRNQILAGNRHIQLLHYKVEKLHKRQELYRENYQSKKLVKSLKEKLPILQQEVSDLEKILAKEKEESNALSQEFRLYRDQIRPLIWTQAVGRRLDNIANPKGGFYQGAVIRKVDAEGITIRHRSGTAKLTIYQTPGNLLDEFDLNSRGSRESRNKRLQAKSDR